ncbi:S46 family peptidase [Elizabethkingia anophelis]|uniref:Dipeptidyl-peptidase n=1 Tax=Elizabethkingia anophelis TaxID=1117645 RepID=A0AAE4T6I4_9FLAO|nr:S46 family peptidase [Elizabethkingia anophelis]AQW89616.1 peptidase S46 [Elizabethkingia anophelis]KUY24556.1 peptidase S46 [Elizabethkingia anophelis]MCT3727174.1 S46 family peptidase [Elizabethkingia anophelis]MCT3758194.1 S46 family peptidase [Elizabethkingia anophelis]MCT3920907.1 S46 family peptidase [Elizabethkingia anophelis]
MKKNILLALALLPAVTAFAQQAGGMWIPTELNEKEMKELGMKISAKDIFNTQKPSIKDAVVQFNGGCTAEIISQKGLLLTNHHCGFGQIQAHSTVQNDLLSNGFWAKNMGEELPNPGVVVDFITDIKEVTNQILPGTENLAAKDVKAVIDKNIEAAKASFKLEPSQKVVIKSMYDGNKYYAFIIETFKDIRLVGAPPQSIGKFGSDTDNWVWPRHTGDFSMFRIYADKNNKPAEYSKDNIPYTPKYSLPVSVKDLKEGDFTFVFGFPGKTTEYLPSIAVEKIINDTDPAKITVRDIALKTLDEKMRTDNATRIKYASKYASVANYWKKWMGEVEGLKKSNAVAKKQAYEQTLAQKNQDVKATVDKFSQLYNEQAPYALNNAYYTEVTRNAETLRLANYFITYFQDVESGKATPESTKKLKNTLTSFYKDYEGELDAKVTAKLLALYAQKTPAEFLPSGFAQFSDVNKNLTVIEDWSKNSIISGRKALNGTYTNQNIDKIFADAGFAAAIKNDPFYKLALSMKDAYSQKVEPKYASLQTEIDALQKKYMKQQLETDKDKKFFPDANSTLRVTYGVVKGSNPRDAVTYGYKTHLAGVMEKYVPGDYEFDVPKKLIDLYNSKDYGMYKDQTGDVPVNFTATNHTTGGNSGSPALDANGNLVGLNFDRQWEGTMSDINFDPRFSRNIMVDTKYILFIIDKFADAKWLINEMKIVK